MKRGLSKSKSRDVEDAGRSQALYRGLSFHKSSSFPKPHVTHIDAMICMVRGSVKEIERCCIFNERVLGIDCGLLCGQEEEHLSKPAIYKESHIY